MSDNRSNMRDRQCFFVEKRHLSIPEFYLKRKKETKNNEKKRIKKRKFVEKHIKNDYNKKYDDFCHIMICEE